LITVIHLNNYHWRLLEWLEAQQQRQNCYKNTFDKLIDHRTPEIYLFIRLLYMKLMYNRLKTLQNKTVHRPSVHWQL